MAHAFGLKTSTQNSGKISRDNFLMAGAFAAALMVSALSVTGSASAETKSPQTIGQHTFEEPIENRMITVTAEVMYDYDMIEPEMAALTSFTLPVYFADGDDRLSDDAEIAIAAFADEALMNGAMHMSLSWDNAPRTRSTQMLASARAENILTSLTDLGLPERLLSLDDFHSDALMVTAGLN